MKVDKTNVVGVCRELARSYGARLKYGPDCVGIKALSELLGLLKIVDPKLWLQNYSMTLGKNDIYLCFRPGDKKMSLADQVAVVAHECIHTAQFSPRFVAAYATSSAHRAAFEMVAMATQMQVRYRLTGSFSSPNSLAETLTNYGCDSGDIAVAKKYLKIVATVLRSGGTYDPNMDVMLEKVLAKFPVKND